jgi:hypothetical protein
MLEMAHAPIITRSSRLWPDRDVAAALDLLVGRRRDRRARDEHDEDGDSGVT